MGRADTLSRWRHRRPSRSTLPVLLKSFDGCREAPQGGMLALLAARVAMSPRHFSRVFAHEFGTTAAQFVERLRIDTARRWLAQSDKGLKEIAECVGFGSVETMNRAFFRRAGELPSRLRTRERALTKFADLDTCVCG